MVSALSNQTLTSVGRDVKTTLGDFFRQKQQLRHLWDQAGDDELVRLELSESVFIALAEYLFLSRLVRQLLYIKLFFTFKPSVCIFKIWS